MKLNKQQIEALTNKIQIEISENLKIKNNLIKEKVYERWLRKNEYLQRAVDSMLEAIKNVKELAPYYSNYYHRDILNTSLEDTLEEIFTQSPEYKALAFQRAPSEKIIMTDIILETIECDNLDELVTKITNKYIN